MNQSIVLTDLRNKIQNTYVLYRNYKTLGTFNGYLITFPHFHESSEQKFTFLQLPRLRYFNSLVHGPADPIHESSEKKFRKLKNI